MRIPVEKAEIVEEMVKLCVRHLRKKKYELNLPKSAIDNAVKCLKVYAYRNGRSWAGSNIIKINVLCWQFGNSRWSEYSRFNDDAVIGRIDVSDNKDILLCLVAHEVSHFIQYTYYAWFPQYLKDKQNRDRGHGECFQTIYRYLRQDLINPIIMKKFEERKAA
tara:strand:+ start:1427 stop:1915 length:489 start_codon:yes stop_codon:yes gene_type:complete